MLGVVQRRVGELFGVQHAADEDQRGAAKALSAHLFFDGGQGAADPILIRPAGAMDHGNRAVRAVMRQQLSNDLAQVHHAQVDGHGRTVARQVAQCLALGHVRLARIAGEDQRL